MAKNEIPAGEAAKTLPGGVTADQIKEWKKQYGDIHVVSTDIKEGNRVTCYLKPVTERHQYAAIYSYIGANKLVEAGELILKNCWLGGDEIIKTNDKVNVSVAMAAYQAMDLPTSHVKKI
jgi:hypothetical protein